MSTEWAVITLLAAASMALPRASPERGLRQMGLLLSFLFWLAAAYLWAVEATPQQLPIVYLHLAPMLLCAAWWLQDSGLMGAERYG